MLGGGLLLRTKAERCAPDRRTVLERVQTRLGEAVEGREQGVVAPDVVPVVRDAVEDAVEEEQDLCELLGKGRDTFCVGDRNHTCSRSTSVVKL